MLARRVRALHGTPRNLAPYWIGHRLRALGRYLDDQALPNGIEELKIRGHSNCQQCFTFSFRCGPDAAISSLHRSRFMLAFSREPPATTPSIRGPEQAWSKDREAIWRTSRARGASSLDTVRNLDS